MAIYAELVMGSHEVRVYDSESMDPHRPIMRAYGSSDKDAIRRLVECCGQAIKDKDSLTRTTIGSTSNSVPLL